MADIPPLRAWLGTLTSDELQVVLEHTPQALDGAHVRNLDELAMRLTHPATISRTLLIAPTPLVQVVETASALGARATVEALAGLLDCADGDRDGHENSVRHWLEWSWVSALLWTDGDVIHLNPGLDEVMRVPLRLARPARTVLAEMTADRLRHLLRTWGITAPARKAELMDAAYDAIADSERFRKISDTAGEDIACTLTDHVNRKLADTGHGGMATLGADDPFDEFDFDHFNRKTYLAEREMFTWAKSAGLTLDAPLWSFGIGDEFVSEIYLALAPADFHVPFSPKPPPVATAPVHAEQLTRSSAAAAADFLGAAMAIYESILRGGAATLKNGGVGAREISRLAKQVRTDTATVRLAVGLAGELRLIELAESGRIRVADAFDAWRRKPPAERTVDLVLAWFPQNVALTLDRDADGKTVPMFTTSMPVSQLPMPYVMCRVLMDFHEEAAIAGTEVAARSKWSHPMAEIPQDAWPCIWSESHRLGVVADGALAPFARALLSHDTAEACRLLNDVLPESTAQATFGSDLTVLVPGSPDADVVDLLDAVAVREGHGVANSWRIGDASIRTALDAGYDADELAEALRKIAAKELPQTVEYLIRDVARRHGQLNVRAAATVIASDDEALLTELLASRSLRSLKLSRIAPTVAVSGKRPQEVLAELRSSGYLPVEVDGAGSPVVQLKHVPASLTTGEHETAAAEDAHPDELSDANLAAFLDAAAEDAVVEGAAWPDRADPGMRETVADVARRLVDGGDDDTEPVAIGDVEKQILDGADRLTLAEAHELADAIESGRPVQIRYRSSSGGASTRTISEMELVGDFLFAYCHAKQDGRTFRLDRILGVAPA